MVASFVDQIYIYIIDIFASVSPKRSAKRLKKTLLCEALLMFVLVEAKITKNNIEAKRTSICEVKAIYQKGP
jgi:hypothetical protein